MSIGRLIVEFEAKTGKFETDTGRAAKIMEKRAREIDKTVEKMAKRIGVAIGAAAAGFALMVKNSIDAADELSKMSQKVGIATENLSKLNYAAELADVSTEELGASLAKLSKTVVDPTKDAQAAFDALGVSIKDSNGQVKGTEQLLLELADAFQKFEDGPEKTAAAMAIFGKTGANLIPLLNGGSKAIREAGVELEKLGGVVSTKAGKAAEEFNDNLTTLKRASTGVANQLAEQLIPAMSSVTRYFIDMAKESNTATRAADNFRVGIGALVVPVVALWNGLQIVAESFAAVGAAATALATGDFKALDAIGEAFGEDRKQNIKDIENAYEAFFGTIKKGIEETDKATSGTGNRKLNFSGDGDDKKDNAADKALKEAQKEYEKQLQKNLELEEQQRESIKSVIEALQDESATMGLTNAQIQARTLEKLGATEAEKRQAYELAKYVDLQKAAEEADKERAAVMKETRTYAEVYADEVARLNFLFENGTRDSLTYNRAVAAAQDAFDKAEKAAEEAAGGMAVFADQAARNMQDAFADFLFNPFDQGLKGMVRSFAQTMQRMAAEALAANIFGALTKGSGGGGGGLFSSLFSMGASFFSGGMSSSGTYTAANIAPRALGGPVMSGTPYLVGERGPELMVPKTAGTIVPNNALGGGNQNIRIVNQFDGGFVGDYMMSADGEKVIDNYISRNGAKIKNLLNNG
jgi:TP901 family phage tail tape measure protein